MKENEKQTTEIVSEENEKSEKKKIVRQPWWPDWFTGRTINEPIFCREFLTKYRLAYTENSFFSVEGKVTDENALRVVIYKMVERETLNPTDIEGMESGNWDLTLFTCTVGGQSRVTIRFELEED